MYVMSSLPRKAKHLRKFEKIVKFYCAKSGRVVHSSKKSSEVEHQPRIFSGIQPTGNIHLGNYFGAIRQWIDFQRDKENGKFEESIYSIVDLHSITMPQDRSKLEKSILRTAATLIACGIDPDKSVLFVQGHVPYHSQLAWVLGCMTTMARLSALPQFKEKSQALKEVPVGLYTYPILQAADILLYRASHIPVGEDNLQHIHFTQQMAQKFNRLYGDTFVIPSAITEKGMSCRVRNLRSPNSKMSKSDPDPRSRIDLIDAPDTIVEKIKKSVTDFTSEVTFDVENRPGVSNLIMMHSLCTNESIDSICSSVRHLDTGKYKFVVSEAIVEFLKPIRTRLLELLEDPVYLLQILKKGSDKASNLSGPVWKITCFNVGISPQPDWPVMSEEPTRLEKKNEVVK